MPVWQKCSCMVKKQVTENKRQTTSITLFRTKEAKDQKTNIMEKSKLLDFSTMPMTTESLSFIHTCFQTAIMLM